MTTALYRRYRPDTFQDVIGQEHVTAPLMAALRADRVTHAYLFSGPRGCGKTTSARILARCLNCEQFPTDTPCGVCPSCRDLATGGPGSLDVVEIDAASHNGVDDARDLRERASFAPARDRFKIFILDEAHMVTPQGFNALLKLVEEPPAHVKFIFATTEPEKVIGTIRSRTHHYPFRLVPPDVLEGYLAHLCQAEDVQVGPGVFPLVTRAGGGSVRDTLSVMDQLIGGAVDGEVDYQRAVALLGYTDTTMLDQCVDAIAGADGAGVFRVVDRVIASGHDPRRFVEDLLQRLRDLLVIALAGAEAGPALGSLPADELERMEVQARTLGSGALSRYADMTAQALTQMVGATSPRLQLELLMARLLVPAQPTQAAQPVARGGASQPAGSARPAPHGPAPDDGAATGQGRTLAAQIARQAATAHAQEPDASQSRSEIGVDGAPPAQQPASVQSPGRRQPAAPSPEAAPVPVSPASSALAASEGPSVPEASSAPVAASAAAAVATEPTPAPEGRSSAPEAADAEMIRTRWGEVLDSARRTRRATWALVEQHAQPGSLTGGVFQVLFTAPGLVNAFENGGHAQVLSEAIHQALGLQVQVQAVLTGGDGPAGGSSGPAGGSGPSSRGPSGSGGRVGAVALPAPSHEVPSAQAEPSLPAPSEPEPVGWGEVAPIGRARQAQAEPAPDPREAGGSDVTASAGSVTAEVVLPREEPASGRSTDALAPVPEGLGTAGDPPQTAENTPATPPSSSESDTDRASTPGGAGSPVSGRLDDSSEGGSSAPTTVSPADADGPTLGRPSEPTPPGEGSQEEPHLATVHRLHALPKTPGGASSSHGPGGSAAMTPEPARAEASTQPAPPTFSDGVPLPEEPGDPDGPGDAWARSSRASSASVSAAMAAARAAARGEAPPPGAAELRTVSLEDDVPSEDDEDAEEAGVVGLEVVKRLLGATVLEEIIVNPEEY
ncbi:DNA polymerase III subunit gamma and tau [Actinomyces faecalis]|uniref:DNA polymerase III subunit gamma and tau n=1 Tax=Actinomyces faecalis TaxID=2722820 RepID=UPI00155286A5|nr:DNA polymerase III subunit gamma and tau [Actinomyces faecalis]